MIEFDQPPPRRPYEAVVPLINIVFLLLIFFLLAGTLGPTDPVDVSLPEGRLDDKAQRDITTLFVEADGFVWLGDRPMDAQMAPYMLRGFFDENNVGAVAIKADAAADAHDLLALMEGLRNVGVEEVTLLTERGN